MKFQRTKRRFGRRLKSTRLFFIRRKCGEKNGNRPFVKMKREKVLKTKIPQIMAKASLMIIARQSLCPVYTLETIHVRTDP